MREFQGPEDVPWCREPGTARLQIAKMSITSEKISIKRPWKRSRAFFVSCSDENYIGVPGADAATAPSDLPAG
jgi:hypothetical protein